MQVAGLSNGGRSEAAVAGHGLFNGERSDGASGWVVQRREV